MLLKVRGPFKIVVNRMSWHYQVGMYRTRIKETSKRYCCYMCHQILVIIIKRMYMKISKENLKNSDLGVEKVDNTQLLKRSLEC